MTAPGEGAHALVVDDASPAGGPATDRLRRRRVSADPAELRRAYACFPSGVVAVCAHDEDEPVGMAASSFTTVSLDPPLVSVCMQDTSTTWPRLRALPRLGVSVLSERHEDGCRSLAAKHGDRFADLDWEADREGAVFLHGAALHLGCSIEAEIPAGDHSVVLLRIHDLGADLDAAPLLFHGSRLTRIATNREEPG